MDFSFSDEQQMLQDTTERFIATRYSFEARQKIRDSAEGWSPALWGELAELGLLALMVPEADGGIGADPVACMLVARATGAGLLVEPYLSSAVIATSALVAVPPGGQRDRLLASLVSGEQIAVLSVEQLPDEATAVRAERRPDGWRLSGSMPTVYHAPLAGWLLVPALHGGRLALFAVPATAPGLHIEPFRTLDDQVAGHLRLEAVELDETNLLDLDATAAIEHALDLGLAASCADAFGSLDRALAATIEYCKSRTQFGAPIGRFQALQHRMADMLMQREQALSMSYLAATAVDEPDPVTRRQALSAAKVCIGQAARYIAQQAVQLHGGMGMTDELDVSHHFRRLTAFSLRFGSEDEHLRRHARLGVGLAQA